MEVEIKNTIIRNLNPLVFGKGTTLQSLVNHILEEYILKNKSTINKLKIN